MALMASVVVVVEKHVFCWLFMCTETTRKAKSESERKRRIAWMGKNTTMHITSTVKPDSLENCVINRTFYYNYELTMIYFI